jgi:hypothetical protein
VKESDFMKQIIELGHLYGWQIAHFRPAWSKDGKRCMTAVSADGKGFPDLCMVKRCRLIFAELKAGKGRLSPEQQGWIDNLTNSMRCECYIWKPENFDEIVEILTRE